MTHTNNPTEQQATPTSEEELLVALLDMKPARGGYLQDYLDQDDEDKIMQLLHQYGNTRELEGRISEHDGWKEVAEKIVEKDGVYRAVNYLNKRAIELDKAKEQE